MSETDNIPDFRIWQLKPYPAKICRPGAVPSDESVCRRAIDDAPFYIGKVRPIDFYQHIFIGLILSSMIQ